MTMQSADIGATGDASGPADRPANFVAAVIHDLDAYRDAVEDLVAQGFPRDSLGLLHGRRGAEAIAGRNRRWWAEALTDEVSYVDRFEEEIRAGGYVVGVPLVGSHEHARDQVRDILKRHGAGFVVSSTRWTHSIEE